MLAGQVDTGAVPLNLWRRSVDGAWSAYRQTVRTNNDVESWHARLNRRAVSSILPFYKLIVLLHSEARQVALCANVLSDRRMQRIQSRKAGQIQQKLVLLWDDLDSGRCSVEDVLRACSRMYARV